eukprot:CFRG6492T1
MLRRVKSMLAIASNKLIVRSYDSLVTRALSIEKRTEHDDVSDGARYVPVDWENIFVCGRHTMETKSSEGTCCRIDWAGVYLVFSVKGAEIVHVHLAGGSAYFNVYINGQFSLCFGTKYDKSTYRVASCLETNKQYIITLVKRTEPQLRTAITHFRDVRVYGFYLSPNTAEITECPKPSLPMLKDVMSNGHERAIPTHSSEKESQLKAINTALKSSECDTSVNEYTNTNTNEIISTGKKFHSKNAQTSVGSHTNRDETTMFTEPDVCADIHSKKHEDYTTTEPTHINCPHGRLTHITCPSTKHPVAADTKCRYFEFVGDSDTCAFGVEGEMTSTSSISMDPSTCNIDRSYARLLSRRFGAVSHCLCWSGKAISKNPMFLGKDTLLQLYDREIATEDKKVSVLEGRYVGPYISTKMSALGNKGNNYYYQARHADVVIVLGGSNDFLLSPRPTDDEFIVDYIALLQKIRERHAKAMILCVVLGLGATPSIDARDEEKQSSLVNTISQLTKESVERMRSSGDDNVHLVNLDGEVSLDKETDFALMMHWNAMGHWKVARGIEQQLVKLTGWAHLENEGFTEQRTPNETSMKIEIPEITATAIRRAWTPSHDAPTPCSAQTTTSSSSQRLDENYNDIL